jgi:hypothetical protein
MNRVVPLCCALALLGLLVWQLVAPSPSSGLARMPVFTPASLGSSASSGLRCPEPAPADPTVQALVGVPLERLLRALAVQGGVVEPRAHTELERVADLQRELRALRNQRHAWNVESMELVAGIAVALDDEQLDWVLSNRDLAAQRALDRQVWERLGLEP